MTSPPSDQMLDDWTSGLALMVPPRSRVLLLDDAPSGPNRSHRCAPDTAGCYWWGPNSDQSGCRSSDQRFISVPASDHGHFNYKQGGELLMNLNNGSVIVKYTLRA